MPKTRTRSADAPTPGEPAQPAADAGAAGHGRLQMADIARLAGVSVATVSRALGGSPLISAATRDRIEALARSLDYSVNVGASNLRRRQNRTVAVVIPYDRVSRQHISDPFFLSMVGSLADALVERGCDMLLSRVDAESLASVAEVVKTGVAVGVVLIGQWRHHDQLNALADRRLPIVVWGAQLADQRYCTVGGDNRSGGLLATRHLLERGRRRIVFIGDTALPEVAQRFDGYVAALQAAGLAPDPTLHADVPFDANRARTAVAGLCDQGVDFDAVFACSDVLASAAMQALHAAGRSVPQDVAVVGYDDIEWASHSSPPLTTLRQPIAKAGAELVDVLLRTIDGERVAPRVLQVELIVRESTAGLPPTHGTRGPATRQTARARRRSTAHEPADKRK